MSGTLESKKDVNPIDAANAAGVLANLAGDLRLSPGLRGLIWEQIYKDAEQLFIRVSRAAYAELES